MNAGIMPKSRTFNGLWTSALAVLSGLSRGRQARLRHPRISLSMFSADQRAGSSSTASQPSSNYATRSPSAPWEKVSQPDVETWKP